MAREVRRASTSPLKCIEYQRNNLLIVWFFIMTIFIISMWLFSWFDSIFLQSDIDNELSDLFWRLSLLIYPIFILSAGLVYYDAKKIMAGNLPSYPPRFSLVVSWTPFLWAILTLLVSIIAFALYLHKRKEIFVANHPGFRIEFKK